MSLLRLPENLSQALCKDDVHELHQCLSVDKQWIQSRFYSDKTMLHLACFLGSYKSVEYLVQQGSDPMARDVSGNTPAHCACPRYIRITSFFGNWNRNAVDSQGDTPFHLCIVQTQRASTVKYLIKHHFDPTILNHRGYSPFHLAIIGNLPHLVTAFLEERVDLIEETTADGETPLWLAVVSGSRACLNVLLDHGADVNGQHRNIGGSPLWIAVYKRKSDTIHLLLDHHANTDVSSSDGISILLLAIARQLDCSILMRLFPRQDRSLLLRKVVLLGQSDLLRELEFGEELQLYRDKKGNTALHLAVLSDSIDMVKLVHRMCGLVSIRNHQGKSPFMIASERESREIVDFLASVSDTDMAIVGYRVNRITEFTMKHPFFNDSPQDFNSTFLKTDKWLEDIHIDEFDNISSTEVFKKVMPALNVEWGQNNADGLKSLRMTKPHLTRMNSKPDDFSSHIIKSVLNYLHDIEKYLSLEHSVFKHLDPCFVPVGSVVEGSKIGNPDELDIFVTFQTFKGVLRYNSGQMKHPIFLNPWPFDKLPSEAKQSLMRFIQRSSIDTLKVLNVQELLLTFVEAIGEAVDQIALPEIFESTTKKDDDESFCKNCFDKNSMSLIYKTCKHKIPPRVCSSKAGAVLNLICTEEPFKNMLITVDLVPNLPITFDHGEDMLLLRSNVITYLMEEMPPNWMNYLTRYLSNDRLYLGHFRDEMTNSKVGREIYVGIKMINSSGHTILRPGTNHDLKQITEQEVVLNTYRLLKFIKHLSGSPVKSYTIKKAVTDYLSVNSLERVLKRPTSLSPKLVFSSDPFSFPRHLTRETRHVQGVKQHLQWKQVFKLTKVILDSDELKGKFQDRISNPLQHSYVGIDVDNLPTNGSNIHLISRNVDSLFKIIENDHCQENTAALDRVLREIKDLNKVSLRGESPLHWAVKFASYETVRKLLNKSCLVNLEDSHHGNTPIFNAIQRSGRHNGEDEAYRLACLLIHKGAELDLRNKLHRVALHEACFVGTEVLVKLLLQNDLMALKAHDFEGKTPLAIACGSNRNLSVVQLLLEAGADVNTTDSQGETPLFYAAELGSMALLETLMRFGADVNSCRKDGTTVLHLASWSNQADVVGKLLEAGANPNVSRKSGVTPLFSACRKGFLEIAKLLIEKGGADVDHDPHNGCSPLLIAAQQGHVDILRLLIESGARVNAQNKLGQSALHLCVLEENIDCLGLLLDQGANPDLRDENGSSALDVARASGLEEAIDLIIMQRDKLLEQK